MRQIISITLVGLLVGCAPAVSLPDRLATWIGHPSTDLVNQFGYPSRVFTGPEGQTVWAYDSSYQIQNASFQMPNFSSVTGGPYATAVTLPGATIGGGVEVRSCSIFYELDDRKIVTLWRYQGNGCN